MDPDGAPRARRLDEQIGTAPAREIVEKLPEGVEKVGVFVNEACSRMEEISAMVGLSAVQFQGDLRFGIWNP
jgi:phosphoribosylanthranilate isomerase